MDLYEVLGVPRDADTSDIRKAFLKLSRVHHPDKGGDAEMFKKVSTAHEVLTDERRRQIYDMTGSIDGENGPHGGQDHGMPFDIGSIFGAMGGMPGMPGFFGMPGMPGMPGRSNVRMPKAPPKKTEIPLRLHDFYHGRTFEVKFERQKFCDSCKGEGATSWQTCNDCQGRGRVRQVIQMGPMQMINEGPCPPCQGAGRKPSGACYMCGGKKLKNQEKVLDVKIEPGMRPGEVLVFHNECSDDPSFDEPGDVHFVLQEASGDEEWSRKGDDLETLVTLTLGESLLGCSKQLKGHPGFPDGLEINIPQGLTNDELLRIPDKGMSKKAGLGFGFLICRIRIQISLAEKEILARNKTLLTVMFDNQGQKN